ncbi:hypothetical protein Mal64_34020 [Pseudobythopirellula maris]|uniref:DUF306 domain-containing protein n=1 Tax=Pseudobythopirellula maris TaxID=2527991 RepID=A0A5C5ZH94_9BACT|nr:hypothetical protein [Pseudobythopirellula maris]TWT86576.1 hypothetical protein Mal64_34020 [Pseudobythopirellula maris]
MHASPRRSTATLCLAFLAIVSAARSSQAAEVEGEWLLTSGETSYTVVIEQSDQLLLVAEFRATFPTPGVGYSFGRTAVWINLTGALTAGLVNEANGTMQGGVFSLANGLTPFEAELIGEEPITIDP